MIQLPVYFPEYFSIIRNIKSPVSQDLRFYLYDPCNAISHLNNREQAITTFNCYLGTLILLCHILKTIQYDLETLKSECRMLWFILTYKD